MRVLRVLAAPSLAVLCALALVACGSSSDVTRTASISANDPAHMVPASSALYASVSLKPGSPQLTSLESVIDRLAGAGTSAHLLKEVLKGIQSGPDSTDYKLDIKPWFEGLAGIAITKWPSSAGSETSFGHRLLGSLLVVLPTSDPAAARRALPALEKGDPKGTTAKVEGHYLLFGGTATVDATSAAPADSLADNTAYRTELAKLGPNPALTLYYNAHALLGLVKELEHGASGESGLIYAMLPKHLSPDASAMFGLSTTAHTIALNETRYGVAGSGLGASAGVGSLPAGSWLAFATGSIPTSTLRQLITGFAFGAAAAAQSAGPVSSFGILHAHRTQTFTAYHVAVGRSLRQLLTRITKQVDARVKSGLGPITFSAAGTSLLNLKVALEVKPSGSNTAAAMLGYVYKFLSGKLPAGDLSGSPSSGSFTIKANALISIDVSDQTGNLTATYGYGNPSLYTSPGSTLSTTPLFKQALRALPSGAKASLFVNLQAIDKLATLDPKLGAGSAGKALAKLKYLIAGSSHGDTRVVLGLK